ncbi:polynucleotide adenylyltransferase [Gluconobacter cerinus NRIC 0229]|uniref:Polynucleotide adenylyltransferase n=2 Tax=Gluconobacter cerinus TaxID=38307 RepID=A0AAV5NHJ2_9PROT|nr:polynucleotide adenylyltransferase [Gluconobacter cerinus NRIC 0229]GLQ63620.1 polynucleotide adenylyltransferase [Gluconobacter cerinus]
METSGLLARLDDRGGLDVLWRLLPEARLVGGSVRDLLRGISVHDLDVATPEPPDIVQDILKADGVRVIPTGLSHGTVTAVIRGVPYEITTLRRDEQTDGRHAVVAWTESWEEDAARRDFTINAMSLDRHDRLHDYFQGSQDLEAHHVRFVGNAGRRIEEDALRALRFFRFDARYGRGTPDHEACTAIAERLDLIDGLSAERIASELLRILTGPRIQETLQAMQDVGLLARIVPAPNLVLLRRLLMCEAPEDPVLRLSALGHGQGELLAERLRLSNADRDRLRLFDSDRPDLAPAMSADDIRRARVEQNLSVLLDRSWLLQAALIGVPSIEWNRLRDRLTQEPQPVFPLGGKEARDAGIMPGPGMGQWLAKGRLWWMNHGCLPGRDACMAYLLDEMGEASE